MLSICLINCAVASTSPRSGLVAPLRSLGRSVAADRRGYSTSLRSLWCLLQPGPVWSALFRIISLCFSAWFRSSPPQCALLRVVLPKVDLLSAVVLSTVLHGEVIPVSLQPPRGCPRLGWMCLSSDYLSEVRLSPNQPSSVYFAQRGPPEGVSPALRPPQRGLTCFSVVVLGTVRSASAWIARVGSAASAWSAASVRSALLLGILSPARSLQSFSQGVFLNGFLFLRVVLPGALFSSVQFSTRLFPPRGSPPVHPQRSSTVCVSLLCGSPSSFLSVAQGAGLHGRACGPHAASTRGQTEANPCRALAEPRSRGSIFVSWPRLHLHLAASAPSSFSG